MTAARRWCLVLAGAAVLLVAPLAVRALPADDSEITATDLLERVQQSAAVPHTGYAESVGSLQLPVADEFSELAALLGERSRLRVWWRGVDDWRVDAIDPAGETDLFHNGLTTTSWDYQAERAVVTPEPTIRLPRSADLLPPQLARLALDDALPEEVSRLPAERIAGQDAPGLRLEPSMPQSTIDHVDVWADEDTGLPLQVEVWGVDSTLAAVSSTFLDVSLATPSAEVTQFVAPATAEVVVEDVFDVAAGADRFSEAVAPRRLAGLATRPGTPQDRPVGQYGRGLTTMVAVPLWDQAADPLREQLLDTPGARIGSAGVALTVGPLNLRLAPELGREDRSWLVAGTVDAATVTHATRRLHGVDYTSRPVG